MANPVVHWEIAGKDVDAMAAFYGGLFGWEPAAYDPDYRLVELPEGIGGGLMRTPEGVPAYVTVYVEVDDLDATLAKVKDLGGNPIVPPTDIPGVGAFAMFQDPEGNTIGIIHSIAA
jgi:predicted enzyme related to lactoylglutathione lyase